MSSSGDAVPGFYGKLPAVGDFVSRRLPRTFLEPWDEWLQSAIVASRNHLQDRWLRLYLTSPIWRFALSPGVCGPRGWTGVLMPSVDRVGRYFPMTIALALPAGASVSSSAMSSAWYEGAEEVALAALEDDGMDVDHFDAEVAGLGAIQVALCDEEDGHVISNFGRGWRLPAVGGHDAAQLIPAVAGVLLEKQLGPCSIWWSEGSEEVEPQLLMCPSLPAVDVFADMLGGGWQPDAWEVWPRYQWPDIHAKENTE